MKQITINNYLVDCYSMYIYPKRNIDNPNIIINQISIFIHPEITDLISFNIKDFYNISDGKLYYSECYIANIEQCSKESIRILFENKKILKIL